MIGLPKTIVIQQCPNSPTVDWAYKLPETIDPENDPVDLDVILKVEKIYFLNEKQKLMSLKKCAKLRFNFRKIIINESNK